MFIHLCSIFVEGFLSFFKVLLPRSARVNLVTKKVTLPQRTVSLPECP